MAKSNSIHVSLPNYAYDRTLKLAKHLKCISNTGNPKAASVVTKVYNVVLGFYADEDFQTCLENEGIDALAYIEKCVNKDMKEKIEEINRGRK